MVKIELVPGPVWIIDHYVHSSVWNVHCDDTLIAVFDTRTEAATFVADVLA